MEYFYGVTASPESNRPFAQLPNFPYTNTMTESALSSPNLVLVFAQAATGLGHLRVTEALRLALPPSVNGTLLNTPAGRDVAIHSLTSSRPILTKFLEYTQSGWREDAYIPLMNAFYRSGVHAIEKNLQTILSQSYQTPKTLLVVATHYGTAYQIGLLKKIFEKKKNIRMILIVVVTDDSPQKVWAIPGADVTFVPSSHTKKILEEYAKSKKSLQTNTFVVSPYILSPRLCVPLSVRQKERRRIQYLSENSHTPIFSIPVSGAAVQLDYLRRIIRGIHQTWNTAQFHIVAHTSRRADTFFSTVRHIPNVVIQASDSQRETIALYDYVFTEHAVGFEITKPSEQAFKAMIPPGDNGGAILLFSKPVGRQEYDNLSFLRRHGRIPSRADQEALWQMTWRNHGTDAAHWRGIMLPDNPDHAVSCIRHWQEAGIFESMGNHEKYSTSPEISTEGAKLFWQYISHYLIQTL